MRLTMCALPDWSPIVRSTRRDTGRDSVVFLPFFHLLLERVRGNEAEVPTDREE